MSAERICSKCGKDYNGALCPHCLVDPATLVDSEPRTISGVLTPGGTFRNLEIVEEIGRGGMGVVYKARQPDVDRYVALKLLPPQSSDIVELQLRFEREAKAMAALSHPNIVQVFEIGSDGDLSFLIMEFIDGPNLRSLSSTKTATAEMALDLTLQICDALEYAHQRGVIHRDIKPENLLLDREGRIKIVDFGIAKLKGSADDLIELTRPGEGIGTQNYSAPEQFSDSTNVDGRADLYSTAVVLYELLTGVLPKGKFKAASKIARTDRRLDIVIETALHQNPEDRHANVHEFKIALQALRKNTGLSPASQRRTNSIPLLLGAFVALLAVIGVVVLVTRPKDIENRTKQKPDRESKETRPESPLAFLVFGMSEGPSGDPRVRGDGDVQSYPLHETRKTGFDRTIRFFQSRGLRGITSIDLLETYVVRWKSCDFVAIWSRDGKMLKKGAGGTVWDLSWSYARGELLVIVLAEKEKFRKAFVDLVRAVQQKLNIPVTGPK